ncbi:MAG TPA: hypothetical protein VFO07_13065 [Roseiflexaceae bacterium]|nr:hypothetical protein [Roseiflexaceae bacterium]
MLTTNTHTRHPRRLDYVLCYVLFALLMALDIAVLLIWRVTILVLIAAFIGPSPANSGIYDFSLVVLGIALFGLIIAAEPYLRNGVKQGRLLYRFACLAVPLGLFGLLGLLLGIWL